MALKRVLILIIVVLVAAAAIATGWFVYQKLHAPAYTNVDVSNLRPVGPDDHILGNPAASVMIVEYCDIDSPFCKQFQKVLEQVIAKDGATGDVAWAYRHLPVANQYPNSENEAEAAECVAAAGGTNAFFAFIDALQAAAPGTATFDPSGYGAVVTNLGLDAGAFSKCLSAGTYAKRVADDADNALAAGGTGAPYTVLLVKGMQPIPIQGALSYTQFNALVEAAVQQTK
jgi:protein-disulfide isomerase